MYPAATSIPVLGTQRQAAPVNKFHTSSQNMLAGP